jgi:hypothetical protein
MTQGVGESKPFTAPEGTYPESGTLDCHVGGVLVRDLPSDMQGKILYQQTDEGIAEHNQGRSELAVHVTDQHDRAMGGAKVAAQRGDVRGVREAFDVVRDVALGESGGTGPTELWEARDPLGEVADAHVGPGMRPHFLSERRNQEAGTRGWKIVKDEHGDPVRVGTLVLGQMPEERAEARNRFFREKSQTAVAQVEQQFHETQEQANREAGA